MFCSLPKPLPNEFWLTLLDVVQGLSAVVQTHKHTLLYDIGPKLGANSDAEAAVIVPYLRKLGIRTIDQLIVSHGDNHHIGGLQGVYQSVHVNALLISEVRAFAYKRSLSVLKRSILAMG